MATVTDNIGLTLPEGSEYVSRQVINGNWQLIDNYMDAPSHSTDLTVGTRTGTKGGRSCSVGYSVRASGNNSLAAGNMVSATGNNSFAQGSNSVASGSGSHATGMSTASGTNSNSEGNGSTASGNCSHAEGRGTQAAGDYQHAGGTFNTVDSDAFDAWVSGTLYKYGMIATVNDGTNDIPYFCLVENSDATFDSSKWQSLASQSRTQFAEIIGNGNSSSVRSNARALDWAGNERLMGDIYVNCNADSSDGTPLGVQYTKLLAICQRLATAAGVSISDLL